MAFQAANKVGGPVANLDQGLASCCLFKSSSGSHQWTQEFADLHHEDGRSSSVPASENTIPPGILLAQAAQWELLQPTVGLQTLLLS